MSPVLAFPDDLRKIIFMMGFLSLGLLGEPYPHAFRECARNLVFCKDRVNRPVFFFVDDYSTPVNYRFRKLGDERRFTTTIGILRIKNPRVVAID